MNYCNWQSTLFCVKMLIPVKDQFYSGLVAILTLFLNAGSILLLQSKYFRPAWQIRMIKWSNHKSFCKKVVQYLGYQWPCLNAKLKKGLTWARVWVTILIFHCRSYARNTTILGFWIGAHSLPGSEAQFTIPGTRWPSTPKGPAAIDNADRGLATFQKIID